MVVNHRWRRSKSTLTTAARETTACKTQVATAPGRSSLAVVRRHAVHNARAPCPVCSQFTAPGVLGHPRSSRPSRFLTHSSREQLYRGSIRLNDGRRNSPCRRSVHMHTHERARSRKYSRQACDLERAGIEPRSRSALRDSSRRPPFLSAWRAATLVGLSEEQQGRGRCESCASPNHSTAECGN